MNQDRRDAAAWAKEWQVKQRNRKILSVLGFLLLIALIGFIVNGVIVHFERTTFKSVEDMRKAMQGRYATDGNYEDIVIEGDNITLTYLAYTHYDREYAEKYGYDYDEQDSVYEDRVVKWDYRHGVIKTSWMDDIIVDKYGNIWREDSYYFMFYKTDEPRPEPIDPSTLNNPDGSIDETPSIEEEEVLEERREVIESTDDAAEEAETAGEEDVQS